ncbi:MAG: hypothetical protein HQ518_27005 [Rhodopirellula sp.]|nr:hypothetical protein [Rhodopirellula sp.]
MRSIVWPLLALLVILHHDFWFWNDPTLVFGWFPIGLLYHVVLSIVAAGFWLLAVQYAWPAYLADEAARPSNDRSTASDNAEAPQA